MQASENREEMLTRLRECDAAYAEGNPILSDAEYDDLRERFAKQWPDDPYLETLWGKKGTVHHERPMLSLAKDFGRLPPHVSELCAQWKVDGVACKMLFDVYGRLIQASTRGDGRVGQDVTDVVLKVFDLPRSGCQPEDATLEIRGEVYMPLSVFNAKYAESFANPRNLAASALRAGSVSVGDLRFFVYGVDLKDHRFQYLSSAIESIKGTPLFYSFDGRIHVEATEIGAWEAQDFYEKAAVCRPHMDFEADGVVFTANRCQQFEALGTTSHHPKGAVAWKFPPQEKPTIVQDIIWQTSRRGIITPVVIVDPVSLSGATVTRVTLHNLPIFEKLALAKGDTVLAVRRGDVIPHIERVFSRSGEPAIQAPRTCPACGSWVARTKNALSCGDPSNCSTAVMRSLLHFLRTLGCDGIGAAAITELVDNELVDKEPASLFRLMRNDEAVAKAQAALGPHAYGILYRTLYRLETEPVKSEDLLEALGIQSIGPSMAKALLGHFGNLTALLEAAMSDPAELEKIPSVGPTRAAQVSVDLHARSEDLANLLDYMPWPKEAEKQNTDGPLAGQVIVFTGPLESMGRSQAQARVAYLGGKAADSVTKDTTLVVTNSDEMTTKRKKAEQLIAKGANLRIINEAELVRMFPFFLPTP